METIWKNTGDGRTILRWKRCRCDELPGEVGALLERVQHLGGALAHPLAPRLPLLVHNWLRVTLPSSCLPRRCCRRRCGRRFAPAREEQGDALDERGPAPHASPAHAHRPGGGATMLLLSTMQGHCDVTMFFIDFFTFCIFIYVLFKILHFKYF